ncbi:MAG: tryptophan synthase subunit beta [Clostridia bacterium]|nr:tryptophan synthase subunit beta [Clostridia bacterium]
MDVRPLTELYTDIRPGYYGEYGGAYVPPALNENLARLAEAFFRYKDDKEFQDEFIHYLKKYVGRPSPLYFAANLSRKVGSRIYLKREDLNHTGAHKINNTIGQVLLARRMGAKEIIAETGAGQHGVATATAAALFGIPCKVFMGAVDIERQSANVSRMKLLNAEVIPATSGTQTLADAVNEALGYFIEHPDSFYMLGSQVGPHPYPNLVGYFQSVIGQEARNQIFEAEGRLPDSIFACVGGGSNAIGLFQGFLRDNSVQIFGAEGGGEGEVPRTAATLSKGKAGVFQGTYSYCLMNEKDEPSTSYSIAAGLDYPGISPQHAFLKDSHRATYYPVSDQEAVDAYITLSRMEGIIPAIESAHAIALAMKLLKDKNQLAIVNLSGRGDKDVERKLENFIYKKFV